MKDDYLWNRSGEPDPEIARLEALLEPLRHRPTALDLSRTPVGRVLTTQWIWRRRGLALAAGLVIFVAAGIYLAWLGPEPGARASAWRIASSTRLGPSPDSATVPRDARVPTNEWIETDEVSTVRLEAGDIGTVVIQPGSRLRVIRTRPGDYRLALARGALHARIWALPGQFAVETSSAVALDLGCAYTLEVDGQGTGRLQVVSGWVGVEGGGSESLVPEGASCRLRPGRGPGTPYFDDAPAALVEAVTRLDASPGEASRADVNAVVATARPRDAFTLWHLLRRLDAARAALVYDRLAALAPPPTGVTRELAIAKDRAALESWWDSLGLGSSSLFRTWRARPGF